MPIYAHRCSQCGHTQDHLMKIDEPSPACPACGSESYSKQLSAPAFALKGSGWYATDFKQPAASPSSLSAPSEGSCGGSCACHPH